MYENQCKKMDIENLIIVALLSSLLCNWDRETLGNFFKYIAQEHNARTKASAIFTVQ